ncbi:MAG TPA: hypothetical protein VF168_10210 [Trueperaceae bacterium]
MSRGLSILVVALSLMLLAGCRIVPAPDPFPNATEVGATTDPFASVASGSLLPGESVIFEVRLSTSEVTETQAVYFELENSLDLYVYNSNGNLYASSSSSNFFATGEAGILSASQSSFEPLVVTPLNCRGSCIIRDSDSSRFFVEVSNPFGSTTSFTLYAYVDQYQDSGEFENDSQFSPVAIPLGEESGAIESIGDVDFYRPQVQGDLTFSLNEGVVIDIRAVVIDESGREIPIVPDEPTLVFPTDLIQVWDDGDDEAAVSANSAYYLTLD